MKIGALFYICKKNKSILSRKKIIVLVLHVDGTNVEEKIILTLNQKQKKIYEPKKYGHDLIGDLDLPYFPDCFAKLDRKGERVEVWLEKQSF